MRRLTHVAFAHPIPIPGTHLRQADFSAADGWSIEDDEGRIVLRKGERVFYTYVSASCVEAAPAFGPGDLRVEAAPTGMTIERTLDPERATGMRLITEPKPGKKGRR